MEICQPLLLEILLELFQVLKVCVLLSKSYKQCSELFKQSQQPQTIEATSKILKYYSEQSCPNSKFWREKTWEASN